MPKLPRSPFAQGPHVSPIAAAFGATILSAVSDVPPDVRSAIEGGPKFASFPRPMATAGMNIDALGAAPPTPSDPITTAVSAFIDSIADIIADRVAAKLKPLFQPALYVAEGGPFEDYSVPIARRPDIYLPRCRHYAASGASCELHTFMRRVYTEFPLVQQPEWHIPYARSLARRGIDNSCDGHFTFDEEPQPAPDKIGLHARERRFEVYTHNGQLELAQIDQLPFKIIRGTPEALYDIVVRLHTATLDQAVEASPFMFEIETDGIAAS